MAEPTKAELTALVEKYKDQVIGLRAKVDGFDPEAHAYSGCVKWLDSLTTEVGGYGSKKRPDKAAIGRVLDTLRNRFGITDDKTDPGGDHGFAETWLGEAAPDPQSVVIDKLIDALRRPV